MILILSVTLLAECCDNNSICIFSQHYPPNLHFSNRPSESGKSQSAARLSSLMHHVCLFARIAHSLTITLPRLFRERSYVFVPCLLLAYLFSDEVIASPLH